MTYDPDFPYLDRLGHELHAAAITEARRRRRWWRRLALLGGVGVAVAVPAVAATTGGFDFGGDVRLAGEPGGPPPVVTAPSPGQRAIDVFEVAGNDASGLPKLRAAVAPYGLRVRVRRRPVADAVVGRIFGVEFPREAQFDRRHRLVLERGMAGTIFVTVGVPSARPTTRGLTLFQVLPQVERAVDERDPAGTGERLRALGFTIVWKLVVDNPERRRDGAPATGVKTVPPPPPDTQILSVLGPGGANRATKRTRRLMIEVAPRGSEVLRSHRRPR